MPDAGQAYCPVASLSGWSGAGVEDDGGGDVCQGHDQGGGGLRTGVEHRELGGLVLPDSGDRFTYLLLHPSAIRQRWVQPVQ